MVRSIKIALVLAGAGLSMLAFAKTDDAAARSRAPCTMEYAPVCGLGRDGVRRNYGNRCVARASGARILHAGECVANGPFCFLMYAPVCARDVRGIRRDYPSLCAAERDNAVLLHSGQCRFR